MVQPFLLTRASSLFYCQTRVSYVASLWPVFRNDISNYYWLESMQSEYLNIVWCVIIIKKSYHLHGSLQFRLKRPRKRHNDNNEKRMTDCIHTSLWHTWQRKRGRRSKIIVSVIVSTPSGIKRFRVPVWEHALHSHTPSITQYKVKGPSTLREVSDIIFKAATFYISLSKLRLDLYANRPVIFLWAACPYTPVRSQLPYLLQLD